MTTSIADQRIREFSAAVASDAPTPGGGSVAGAVAALGAALVGMAGRYAERSDPSSAEFQRIVELADTLRSRSLELADADVVAYNRYVEVSRSTVDHDARRTALHAASDAAADVPYELGALAAQIAEAGEELVISGNPRLRTDACSAALLGSVVAITSALLVEENLHSRPGDQRISEAMSYADRAVAAADRATQARGFHFGRVSS